MPFAFINIVNIINKREKHGHQKNIDDSTRSLE